MIDLFLNENVSIEQLIQNKANKELYTNNIDELLQNLNINNKKLFYVPKKSGEVNSKFSESFIKLLTSTKCKKTLQDVRDKIIIPKQQTGIAVQ